MKWKWVGERVESGRLGPSRFFPSLIRRAAFVNYKKLVFSGHCLLFFFFLFVLKPPRTLSPCNLPFSLGFIAPNTKYPNKVIIVMIILLKNVRLLFLNDG